MRVLIAVDGSSASVSAVEMAGTLIGGRPWEVSLLYVMPQHYVYGKGGAVLVEAYDLEERRADAKHLLETAEKRLQAAEPGITIRQEIETGDPAHVILAVAVEEKADLIVLGSRGLNVAKRFFLGSVSSKVTSHAHCPVLVVHPTGSLGTEPAQEHAAVLGA